MEESNPTGEETKFWSAGNKTEALNDDVALENYNFFKMLLGIT